MEWLRPEVGGKRSCSESDGHQRKGYMLERISGSLARTLSRSSFVTAPPSKPLPFGIELLPAGRMACFGPRHPDKVFYVIWRERYGVGFFSNASQILCHLIIADSLGMEPVVDLENFPTLYNEDEEVCGTRNAWEYYFKQTSSVPLREVYESQHVFFCDGKFPSGFSYYASEIPESQGVFDRFVTVRPDIEDSVNEWMAGFGPRTLGVHFRGQEQNRAAGHPFAPTERQILDATARLIRERNFDRIFLVTEDQRYLDLFRNEFGSLVWATDSFRTRGKNAYRMRPRPLHRYLLGREVLVDALLLSRCQALVASWSNVSEFAKLMNGGKYEVVWSIWNGRNSRNPLLALYQYGLRKRLPPTLGGLPGRILETGAGASSGHRDV